MRFWTRKWLNGGGGMVCRGRSREGEGENEKGGGRLGNEMNEGFMFWSSKFWLVECEITPWPFSQQFNQFNCKG